VAGNSVYQTVANFEPLSSCAAFGLLEVQPNEIIKLTRQNVRKCLCAFAPKRVCNSSHY
jgi:hypothetical protein